MPQKAWTDKRERQYEHIKDSYEDRGVSADEAEERAARTVNKERAEHGETKAAKKRRRDRDRLRALERGAHRSRPRVERERGGGGGLLLCPDLRPLPSLDRSPGAEPVRVERPRRDRRGDREAQGRDRRHLPDDPDPPRDHRPGGGDHGIADARPLLPRSRERREPQRAHPGHGLAGVGRSRRDARGGRRGHPEAVERRGDQPPRPLLHRPERAHLLAPREPAADLPGGRWQEGCPAGGPHRRWPDRDRPGRRAAQGVRGRGRHWAALRPGHPVLGGQRAQGEAHRARVVADRRHPWRGDTGAPEPGPFRAADRIDHARTRSPRSSRAVRIRNRTWPRSANTSMPGTTTSTSTRSVPTRPGSCASPNANSCRPSSQPTRTPARR